MNPDWLKIYKKYRERKYERDLDKLRNNLANRGLAQSGIRQNEERWLKENYEDDAAMKEQEVRIETEKALERRTSIWTNRILASVAIVSLFGTLYVSWRTVQLSNDENLIAKKQQLPVFVAERKEASPITSTSTEQLVFINRGGECYNLTPQTFSFFEIDIHKDAFQEIYILPIETYFNFVKKQTCSYVEFTSISWIISYIYYNRGEAQKTINAFYEKSLNEGWTSHIFLKHYVALTYQNIFGEFRTDYYSFSPPIFPEGILVDSEEWTRTKDVYSKKQKIRASESGDTVLKYLEDHNYDCRYSSSQLRLFQNFPCKQNKL